MLYQVLGFQHNRKLNVFVPPELSWWVGRVVGRTVGGSDGWWVGLVIHPGFIPAFQR